MLRLWRMIKSRTAPDGRKLDWLYLRNPVGRGIIYLLWHDPSDTPVGVACAGRRDILVDGEVVEGAVCGDLVIDPAHRGLGPALCFRNFVLADLRRSFELFYAFPNERLAKAIAAAGPDFECELLNMVLPLRLLRYLRRYLPGKAAGFLAVPAQFVLDTLMKIRAARSRTGYQEAEADEPFLDALWQRAAAAPASIGVRDGNFLGWRLRQHPSATIFFFAVNDRSGSPAAYLAYETGVNRDAQVIDALAVDNRAFAACCRLFVYKMRQQGKRSVSVRKATEPEPRRRVLRRLGFLVSARSRGFVFCSDRLRQALAKNALYLNAVDSDV